MYYYIYDQQFSHSLHMMTLKWAHGQQRLKLTQVSERYLSGQLSVLSAPQLLFPSSLFFFKSNFFFFFFSQRGRNKNDTVQKSPAKTFKSHLLHSARSSRARILEKVFPKWVCRAVSMDTRQEGKKFTSLRFCASRGHPAGGKFKRTQNNRRSDSETWGDATFSPLAVSSGCCGALETPGCAVFHRAQSSPFTLLLSLLLWLPPAPSSSPSPPRFPHGTDWTNLPNYHRLSKTSDNQTSVIFKR